MTMKRKSFYIKSEKTIAHATFTKVPSAETIELVKRLMDKAYEQTSEEKEI